MPGLTVLRNETNLGIATTRKRLCTARADSGSTSACPREGAPHEHDRNLPERHERRERAEERDRARVVRRAAHERERVHRDEHADVRGGEERESAGGEREEDEERQKPQRVLGRIEA